MSFLNNIKISVKLPLIMLSMSAAALISMGILAYFDAKETLKIGAKERMEIALAARTENVSTWHKNLSKEVITQSSSPLLRRAVTEFIGAWTALPGNKTEFLREHFPAVNPNEEITSKPVDFSTVQTDYARRHRRHHPFFQTLMERNSYYDVFLFDPDGNLIYTAAKEPDFATNFATGEYKETGLAKAFQRASVLGENETVFIDMEPYAPSNGDNAGFMAAPILSVNGSVIGVYAIQISTKIIHEMFGSNAGLGETGLTVAVGQDRDIRLSSKHSDEAYLSKIELDSTLVDIALSGETGNAITVGSGGKEVLAVYAPLYFGDVTWAVIAQQETAELLMPAVLVRNKMMIDSAIIAAISAFLAIFMARSVGGPLARVGDAMKKVAREEYDTEIPALNRGDEIGEIALVLENFRDELKTAKNEAAEMLFKGTAFEGVSSGLMLLDQGFKVQTVNASVTKMLAGHEEEFKTLNADFDAHNVIGRHIDIFQEDPEHVRDMLSDPANLPFYTEIQVGNARFSLNINAVLNAQGEQIGCVVEWQDITASQMGDAILKAIEENQAKAEFTPDGVLVTANENFLNLLGGTDGGQIGKSMPDLINFDEELTRQRGHPQKRLANGTSVVGRFNLSDLQGSGGTLEGAFSPVHDRSGNVVRILLVGNDVTKAQKLVQKVEADRLEGEKAQAEVVEALRVGMRQLSEGDLTTKITQKFQPDYETLRSDFNGAVSTLRDAMLHVTENAESIRGEASDISNAADDLSRRTERQAATLEQTAAALDELTASVRSAAGGAEQANQVVADARENAESSGEVVREAVAAMGEIQTSSSQISRIISVIDDIAFQTNLLALNAGVEAARAGEAGRGFAVVASEVRALAQRSSDAAKEINDLISASGQHVTRGVDLVGRAGNALGEIFESVSNISTHVSEIALSSNEQSRGLAEINTSVNRLDQVTQQNAAMFEETTAASHALTREAEVLSETMSRFKTGSEKSNVVAANFQPEKKTVETPTVADVPKAQPKPQAVIVEQTLPAAEGDWEDF